MEIPKVKKTLYVDYYELMYSNIEQAVKNEIIYSLMFANSEDVPDEDLVNIVIVGDNQTYQEFDRDIANRYVTDEEAALIIEKFNLKEC